jgi:hypothetical protein
VKTPPCYFFVNIHELRKTGKPFRLAEVADSFERADRPRRERTRSVRETRALLQGPPGKQAVEKTCGKGVSCSCPVDGVNEEAAHVTFERVACYIASVRAERDRGDSRPQFA